MDNRLIVKDIINHKEVKEITIKYIIDNADAIDDYGWNSLSALCTEDIITDERLVCFFEKWNWHLISKKKLEEPFIERNFKRLDLVNVSEYSNLSEEFIIKNKENLNWYRIYRHQKITIKIIDKCWERINFFDLFQYQKFNEKQVCEMIEISKNKNKDKKTDFWRFLSMHGFLDEHIIEENINSIFWPEMVRNENISIDLKKKYYKRIIEAIHVEYKDNVLGEGEYECCVEAG